jgi:hypothetical protein
MTRLDDHFPREYPQIPININSEADRMRFVEAIARAIIEAAKAAPTVGAERRN